MCKIQRLHSANDLVCWHLFVKHVTSDRTSNAEAAPGIDGRNSKHKGGYDQTNNNRHPGLPLPHPIPEMPVKPYVALDKEELQMKVDEETAKSPEHIARLNLMRQFLNERQRIREPYQARV